MLDKNANSWYLVQYKPKGEKIALKNLKRQGFDTFYPVYINTERINLKFTNKIKPLFPGYIFVAFNINNNNWIKIKSTYGVSRVVSIAKIPLKVPLEIIIELKKRCNELEIINTSKIVSAGDKVKIVKGPFTGFIGKIDKINSENRVIILFDFLKKSNKVSVDSKDILTLK